MDKLPVAKHLTDREYKLFLSVYANHSRSMGLDARKDYSLSHVTKVKQILEGLEVHYSSGDWWHYTNKGEWY